MAKDPGFCRYAVIRNAPMRSKALIAGAMFLAALGISARVLVVSPPPVPTNTTFALDLSAMRRLARATGDVLPVRLNVLVVAEIEKPLIGALGEFRTGSFTMPLVAFQIVYDDRFFVVDAAADASLHRERNASGRFHPDRFESLQTALRAAAGIVFTHEHPDHVGGVARSPHLSELRERVLLTREQLANGPALNASGFPQTVQAGLRPLDYDTLARVAPGLVLIKAPGHTPGSQIVYVGLRNGREYLLVGDIAWHRAHFEEPRGHPRLSAWMLGENLPRVLAQLRSLHELWRSEGIVIVPSHDGALLEELVASGRLGSGFE